MSLAAPTRRALSTARTQVAEVAAHLPGAPLFPVGHSARIVDAVLMGLIVMRVQFMGTNLPVPQAAVILLLGICLFRRPTRDLGAGRWYPVLMIALLAFLVVETFVNGLSPLQRGANLSVLALMAAFLGSGRIDVPSALKGIGVALVVNTVLFYLHLAPDTYEGKLTGFLNDKNAGALVYAVGALLASLTTQRVWLRAIYLAGGAVAVVLTDSRTTMAAYAVAVVWLLLSQRLNRAFQVMLGAGLAGVFLWANDNLAEIGRYATLREGSDAFRERIGVAAEAKVAVAPWYGSGLSTATVQVEGGTWFFHDSYLGLLVEGGVIFLIVMLLVYALVGLGWRLNGEAIDATGYTTRTIAAATIVILLCSARLGEVLVAPIGFVVIGVGLANLAAASARQRAREFL